MADSEIEQLKELVRQNIALSQDTNRVVHGLRRTSRLKSIFWLLIFCLSVGSSLYTYFYFIEPRINQIKTIYQKDVAPLQNASGGILDFFKNFGSSTSTKPQ